MSAKTKIVVLHMKNIIFTGIFIGLGILLLLILFTLYYPHDQKAVSSAKEQLYHPGVYTSSLFLGDSAIDVAVTVDENNINSISLVNLSETVETMYPLVKPAMEDLSKQIIADQSTENITYAQNNQYTSIVLLNAIDDALSKAK